MQLLSWLKERGLDEHAPLLEENGIDLETLALLEYSHLAEMGLSIGVRLKLLKAIDKDLRPPQEATSANLPGSNAERRQLTAMFCDIVGYTSLSADLDPEETRRLLREHWQVVKRTAARFGGHIAQYLGDGALIYFGYPSAREDDAERAVNAALALLAHYNVEEGQGAANLHLRIGVATGPVVVGMPSHAQRTPEDFLAVGSNVNLASRLQAMAMPNNLLIDDVTRQLVGDLFIIEPLGEQQIAGLDKRQKIFQVVAPRSVRSRFEAQRRSHVKVFLGRKRETEITLDAWREAQAGQCRVVMVKGEPGIGKSHFVWQAADTIAAQGYETIQLQCAPGQANTPFYPLAEGIKERADIAPGVSDDEKAAKLRAFISSEISLSEADLDVLAGLIGLRKLTKTKPWDNPVLWRQQAFQVLRRFFAGKAAMHPLLLLVEDMHWCDPTTLELLQSIVSENSLLPILVIATSRPDGWQKLVPAEGEATIVSLERLTAEDTVSFINGLLGGSVPKPLSDLIFERTDGVPLFVEELTNVIREKNLLQRTDDGVELSRQLDRGDIPSNLHGVLMARLDRLGRYKRLAQVASCIGRSFSTDILAGVAGVDQKTVHDGLDVLQSSELIHAAGGTSASQFAFRHALIRDAAYGSLLASDRRDIHSRVVDAMLEFKSFDSSLQPENMAFHLARAERFEEAIEQWREAAVAAKYRSASEEAIAHLRNGLDLLGRVKDESRREALEFSLLTELVAPYRSVRGFAAPEVAEVTQRAIQLADQAKDVKAILTLLYNQWVYLFVTAHRDDGEGLIDELFARCSYDRANLLRMTAHRAKAANELLRGRFQSARQNFETSIGYYDPQYQAAVTHSIGLDALVAALGYNALACWCLGDTDAAEENIDRALSHSAALKLAGSQAFAAYHEALLRGVLMERADVLVENGRLLQGIGFQNHFRMWMACGRLLEAMGLCQRKPTEEAVRLVEQRLEEFKDMGVVYIPTYETFIARRWMELENADEGLAHVRNARLVMEQFGERWNEAEVDRVEAELRTLAGCEIKVVEDLLHQAIRVSELQQALPFRRRVDAASLALQG